MTRCEHCNLPWTLWKVMQLKTTFWRQDMWTCDNWTQLMHAHVFFLLKTQQSKVFMQTMQSHIVNFISIKKTESFKKSNDHFFSLLTTLNSTASPETFKVVKTVICKSCHIAGLCDYLSSKEKAGHWILWWCCQVPILPHDCPNTQCLDSLASLLSKVSLTKWMP